MKMTPTDGLAAATMRVQTTLDEVLDELGDANDRDSLMVAGTVAMTQGAVLMVVAGADDAMLGAILSSALMAAKAEAARRQAAGAQAKA